MLFLIWVQRRFSTQLSIHRPPSTNHNQPSCFDLSPLYGLTSGDTKKIRLNDGTGMLAPDCFCEDRVALLPPAVSAMLILWNRNHNVGAYFTRLRMTHSCIVHCKTVVDQLWKKFQISRLKGRAYLPNCTLDQLRPLQKRNWDWFFERLDGSFGSRSKS